MGVADIAPHSFCIFCLEQLEDATVLGICLAQQFLRGCLLHSAVIALDKVTLHLLNQRDEARVVAWPRIGAVKLALDVVVFGDEAAFDGEVHGAHVEAELRQIFFRE